MPIRMFQSSRKRNANLAPYDSCRLRIAILPFPRGRPEIAAGTRRRNGTGEISWRVIANALIELNLRSGRSSSPGEFHPEALTEPYVTLSRHTALHSDSLSLARNRRLWKERLLLVAQLAHGFRRAMSPSSLHVHYRRFITTTG